MSKTTNCWNWIEVSGLELAGQSFESLTVEYRGEKPVALFTPLQHLKGYAVLNLFAPLHAALWAAANYSGFVRKCYETIDHLHGNKIARALFMNDLRRAKIRKDDRQIRLFDAYAQVFKVSGRGVPNLGEGSLNYSENWRFLSVGFPIRYKDIVIEYLEQAVIEFGNYSFFRIDESVRLADPRGRSSLGFYLFNNIDYFYYGKQAEREQFKQEVLLELKLVVGRLEAGIGFDTPVEPIWLIKGSADFYGSTMLSLPPPELEDAVAREILSYRARLIRLLGWPHQYNVILNSVNTILEIKNEIDLGEFRPYDIESELRAYLDEMEQRYPILKSNAVMWGS